jgi:hypothetical protein
MSVVRPEFGPTLPELLGPRLRALPAPVRGGLAVLGAAVVAVVLWALLLRGGSADRPVVVRGPVAFNFIYRAPLHRAPARPGELVRLATGTGQSMAVRPLHLPAYRGDSAGILPIWATRAAGTLERRLPGFQTRTEGRANINKFQGYEMVFQYRSAGRLVFGRRVFLLPQPTARDGVEITVLAPRTAAVPNADAAGHNGPLKTALRSFRFGTQRP